MSTGIILSGLSGVASAYHLNKGASTLYHGPQNARQHAAHLKKTENAVEIAYATLFRAKAELQQAQGEEIFARGKLATADVAQRTAQNEYDQAVADNKNNAAVLQQMKETADLLKILGTNLNAPTAMTATTMPEEIETKDDAAFGRRRKSKTFRLRPPPMTLRPQPQLSPMDVLDFQMKQAVANATANLKKAQQEVAAARNDIANAQGKVAATLQRVENADKLAKAALNSRTEAAKAAQVGYQRDGGIAIFSGIVEGAVAQSYMRSEALAMAANAASGAAGAAQSAAATTAASLPVLGIVAGVAAASVATEVSLKKSAEWLNASHTAGTTIAKVGYKVAGAGAFVAGTGIAATATYVTMGAAAATVGAPAAAVVGAGVGLAMVSGYAGKAVRYGVSKGIQLASGGKNIATGIAGKTVSGVKRLACGILDTPGWIVGKLCS